MIKVRDITEAKAIDLFTSQFGTDIEIRYEKFVEETTELHEAMSTYIGNKSPEALEHLRDEFSDVQGTFTHLASLFSLYQQEMLHNCIDKVTGRMIDPNYKRFTSGREMFEVGKVVPGFVEHSSVLNVKQDIKK
jgi:NTP pyrophosphatase (non-canonical NTP hydrolase)